MRSLKFLWVGLALAASPGASAAGGQYEFLAAPQINLSLVYRLDKLTGDVIACKFDLNPNKTEDQRLGPWTA